MFHTQQIGMQNRSTARSGRSLDLVHLARQTMGDPTLEREVLGIFRRQARLMLFRLEACTDPSGRLEIAHTLKGSAKSVGAARVVAAAEALERAIKAGKPPVGPLLADLAESVAEAVGQIDALLTEH